MTPPPHSLWRSWVILGVLLGVCLILAWRLGGPQRVGQAFASGGQLFVSVLPSLFFGFSLAGFLHVLLPEGLISSWMGAESGFRGLLVGTLAGALTPGGPFTHFPILASFLSKGAGVGPVCAYIAAWALIGLNRFFIWELPILGAPFALVRLAVSAWVPLVVGWLGGWLYRLLHPIS